VAGAWLPFPSPQPAGTKPAVHQKTPGGWHVLDQDGFDISSSVSTFSAAQASVTCPAVGFSLFGLPLFNPWET
jgi:hypothetical protein